MATAQTFIESALRKIQIKGAETPLTTQELDDGLEVLNDMGAQLEVEGFELGYTELAAVGDTVTVPSYSNEFYKLQLAARLATEYAVEFNTSLVESLKAARRSVVRELNRKAVGSSGTFQNIVYGAFELSGVKSGSEPINTAEMENAIPRLNDLMTELESRGFRLNYQINTSTSLTGLHGLPDWCWAWIKAEMSIRLSSSYSIAANDVSMRMASSGEAAAYKRMGQEIETFYPSTLPIGSNRHTYSLEFYDGANPNDLQTGTGNPLSTDDGLTLEIDI